MIGLYAMAINLHTHFYTHHNQGSELNLAKSFKKERDILSLDTKKTQIQLGTPFHVVRLIRHSMFHMFLPFAYKLHGIAIIIFTSSHLETTREELGYMVSIRDRSG